jgi:hypothetical protein
MFGRLKVLESKLDIYEDLSKEMLDKLERAVTSIQENTNKTAIILERHENRLDEVDKSDQLILKMIEEMKNQHDKDTKTLHDRLSNLQKKVDHNAKFVVGAGAVLATLVAVLQVVPPVIKFLTPTANASMMPRAEVVSFVNGSN